ncbi:MAG: hypothetical protein AVDCRST_MAG96-720 [uncultured Segetibacter sp.]|uniref:CHRD domain-containing protein n=1 Tax=uncultured Segetibacter sp. TaxID=481133 RepID=A0A6J4RV78_9BACT|nr:MAG: hypothetical protein AVDCRST_MAG96-720 [uncultured Segetibacter sp.]
MKNWFLSGVVKWTVLSVLALFFVAGCGKDEDTPPLFQGQSKTYILYNYSTGSPVEAGSFTFTELQNGGASAAINVSTGYRVAGVKFKATITVADAQGVELVYADLGDVDGTLGTGAKNPIISSGTNTPIKYNDLISKVGYTLKVMNGNNVQAKGTI